MITTRVETVRFDVPALLAREAAQIVADEARDAFAEAEAINARTGLAIEFWTSIDGVRSTALDRVRTDVVIHRSYDLMPLVLTMIGHMLWQHSPVKTGRYQQSHWLMVDGDAVAFVSDGDFVPKLPEGAAEFGFVPTVRYARALEYGHSKQAPDGVYQVVAAIAAETFSGLASVAFGWSENTSGLEETVIEQRARPGAPRDLRNPAIFVRPI